MVAIRRLCSRLSGLLGPQARQDRVEEVLVSERQETPARPAHWALADRLVLEALARLALLQLAPPDLRASAQPDLLEHLASQVVRVLQGLRVPQGLLPASQVPRVLQEVWDRLDRPAQVALAQAETPAVQALWELQAQAEIQARPATPAVREFRDCAVPTAPMGSTGPIALSQAPQAIPALLAALAQPDLAVRQGLRVRQVLQAARGQQGPQVLSARQATQVARELLDQQDRMASRGHKVFPGWTVKMVGTARTALSQARKGLLGRPAPADRPETLATPDQQEH